MGANKQDARQAREQSMKTECVQELGGTQAGGRLDHTAQGKVPDAQGGDGRQTQTQLVTETLTSPLGTKRMHPPIS